MGHIEKTDREPPLRNLGGADESVCGGNVNGHGRSRLMATIMLTQSGAATYLCFAEQPGERLVRPTRLNRARRLGLIKKTATKNWRIIAPAPS
jgi:hypothetical protein